MKNKSREILSTELIKIASKYLMPLLIIFSLFLLFRGHNHPGGGFIGGLTAGSGVFFYAFAYGSEKTLKYWFARPWPLIICGLTIIFFAAIAALIFNKPLLSGLWIKFNLPLIGQLKLGTPLLFDGGVYLLVMGGLLLITISLMEEYGWK